MSQQPGMDEISRVKERIEAEIRALPARDTASMRPIRKDFSRQLAGFSPEFVLGLAGEMIEDDLYRWFAYELVANHRAAFQSLGEAELEALSQGINSWWTVDSFARTLSGPAWLHGLVRDELIHRWAGSEDRWRRRAALVSTVALNVRSQGGYGDAPRTLDVCRLLVGDHDDMVVKALSWALRELVAHDPEAVRHFLDENENILASRARREVQNKLFSGYKNPKRPAS